jgi:hypothetical protein
MGIRFNDSTVVAEHRYSLGNTDDGRHYLSIPVRNPYVEYEEYFEIDSDQFGRFSQNPQQAVAFAEACRRREKDALLIVPPGRLRGTPI